MSFVLQTVEGLQKALDKENVYIKGTRIQKEPSSSARRVVEKSLRANGCATDLRSSAVDSSTNSLSTFKIDSTITSWCKVAVGGIPMHTSLLDVQRALSKYGEIILTTMKQDDSGSYTAYLEFKVTKFCGFNLLVKFLLVTPGVMVDRC